VVAEHFGQRHLGAENRRAVLGLDATILPRRRSNPEQIALGTPQGWSLHLHDRSSRLACALFLAASLKA